MTTIVDDQCFGRHRDSYSPRITTMVASTMSRRKIYEWKLATQYLE